MLQEAIFLSSGFIIYFSWVIVEDESIFGRFCESWESCAGGFCASWDSCAGGFCASCESIFCAIADKDGSESAIFSLVSFVLGISVCAVKSRFSLEAFVL